jgi:PEP-CTERM motif-containing protein
MFLSAAVAALCLVRLTEAGFWALSEKLRYDRPSRNYRVQTPHRRLAMRRTALAAAVMFLIGSSPYAAVAYTILPPDSVIAGKSIADWTAAWWTWALQAPNNTNPLSDPNGGFAHVQNNGPVFFIAGNNATRSFTVPAGKPILLPLINFVDLESVPTDDPKFSLSEREAAASIFTSSWVNAVDKASLFASIDGNPVANPSQYLEVTNFFDMGPVQADSFLNVAFGIPAGTEAFPTKSAGYWLMIDNLAPGSHTLHFGGSSQAFDIPENCCNHGTFAAFSTETTDTISVVPEPSSALLVLVGLVALFGLRRQLTAAD